MVKALLTVVLGLGVCAAAHAAPSVTSRQATVASSHQYWLSDGLNRLAFWQSPAVSQPAKRKAVP